MPIYMNETIDADVYCDFSRLPPTSLDATAWQPYPGASALAAQLRKRYPAGVDSILIGLLKVPGVRVLETRRASGGVHVAVGDVNGDGIIAILIGLLLPAVQKVRAAESADRQILSAALKAGGKMAVAMGDGSVRVLGPTGPGSAAQIGNGAVDGGILRFLRTGIVSPRDAASGMATGRRRAF